MRYVIIGNGMAGISAAVRLRSVSPDAEIVLYTDEPYTFYSRPGLMYHMMGVEKEWDLYCDRPYLYDKHKLELKFDKVNQLNLDRDELILSDGSTEPFDKLLLAVGATPRKLGCPGEDLDGVYNFTLMSDAKAMMASAREGLRGVVIGGGLLGAEISEVWRRFGMNVTTLVLEDWYFPKALSEEQGRVVEKAFTRHKVDIRLKEEVAEFISQNGKLTAVRTKSGLELSCDMACVTIGVEPRKTLAKESGIDVAKGILVDSKLQTSRPNVYACGDCAEVQHPITNQKFVELLWYSARAQGNTVAASMVGLPRDYEPGIFYNSAMFFDVDYISVGSGRYPGDGQADFTLVSRNGKAARRFVHKDGHITGITSVGTNDRYEDLLYYIKSAYPVDEVALRLGSRRWFGR